MAETNDDLLSSLRELIQSELVDMNTSINAVVVSYKDGMATVRPTADKLFKDGETLPFPEIPNVPIRWPSFNGGRCGLKGPIRAGDKVLLVFSQQAIDGTDDARRHDLSDAYAIPASNDLVGQATNNDDMIMWFGSAYIKITEAGKFEVVAPGGSSFTTPSTNFSGTATVAGKTTMNGGFDSTGSATNNSKNIGSGHKHGLVRAGTDQSGSVV